MLSFSFPLVLTLHQDYLLFDSMFLFDFTLTHWTLTAGTNLLSGGVLLFHMRVTVVWILVSMGNNTL